MSKHTPGPWGVATWPADGPVECLIATVAFVGDCVVGPEFENAHSVNYERHGSVEADARLIAAAPELLAALREMRDRCEMRDRWEPECDAADRRMLDAANAAIAKATGEEA